MKTTRAVALPVIGLLAGTRAAGGAGLALLLAGRLDPPRRRAVGWTLLLVGVLSTFPLVAMILSGRAAEEDALRAGARGDVRSAVGASAE